MSAIRAFCVSVMAALLACSPTLAAERQTGRVTVLAAASLTDAMQQIGRSYEAANGSRIVFSFAASMTLARMRSRFTRSAMVRRVMTGRSRLAPSSVAFCTT